MIEYRFIIAIIFCEVNMQITQSQFWSFSVVGNIHRNIDLVRNHATGQLMVRRISAPEDYPVMKALCGIRHPNLMSVYSVRIKDGVCVSLCEFINGVTLAFLVENNGTYRIQPAKNIICQICDGLTVLHQHGMVHRDIKPENVMLNKSGRVKIIDFSISRLMKPEKRKDTNVLGTAGYASPEQFGFGQTNGRADIYACGVLLNYLLTGKLPIEELHQGVLRDIIEQCIEIDERKRFQTTNDFKMVLMGKKHNRRRPIQPPPGFRSKRVLPKILTTLFYVTWIIMLFIYINGFSMLMSGTLKNAIQQIVLCADLMLFGSLLPYLFFGDAFRMSEKINPDNPQNGKFVLRVLGTLSILISVILIIVTVYISQSL